MISGFTFKNCKNLKTITLPKTVSLIGMNSFEGSGLEEIKIPSSIDTINNEAFKNCKNLKTVKLHSKLKYIGPDCFYGDTKIKSITIPKSFSNPIIKEYGYQYSVFFIDHKDMEDLSKYNPFTKCSNLTLKVYKGSFGEKL